MGIIMAAKLQSTMVYSDPNDTANRRSPTWMISSCISTVTLPAKTIRENSPYHLLQGADGVR